jgi:RNA polymerase sigma-70 factor, ECF subfamily
VRVIQFEEHIMASDFESASDEELVRQTQAGSLVAFEELVYRYEHRIYGFVFQYCHNDADAREITQDAFVRAFQAIGQFVPRGGFGPWLFTIARRKCIDRYRATVRTAADEPVPELPDHDDPAELLARREERQGLWDLARKRLREPQFQALWLRYAEGMSVAGVARVLRKTQTHVKVLLFRGREALRRELEAAQTPDAPAGPVKPSTRPGRGDVLHRTCEGAGGVRAGKVNGFSRRLLIPEPAIAKKGLL